MSPITSQNGNIRFKEYYSLSSCSCSLGSGRTPSSSEVAPSSLRLLARMQLQILTGILEYSDLNHYGTFFNAGFLVFLSAL